MPITIVMRSSRMAVQMARYSSGLGKVTTVMPLTSGSQRPVFRPKTWKNGRLPRMMSCSPELNPAVHAVDVRRRLRCVSGTTFGDRSLPLVKRMTALSSSRRRQGRQDALERPASRAGTR